MAEPAEQNDSKKTAISRQDREAIKSRLNKLDDAIDDAKARYDTKPNSQRRGTAIGVAFRLATELVVGLLVGAFIGWWIDKLLGTKLIFLLLFTGFGFAAGIFNVVRAAKTLQKQYQDDVASQSDDERSGDD